MIKNKEISSAELTKSVFDRIKAVEGKVDAYLTLDEENAMKKAAEIDEKLAKGEELSPLAGIPVGIKDNISTKGLRTTCASKMLGYRCNRQAQHGRVRYGFINRELTF